VRFTINADLKKSEIDILIRHIKKLYPTILLKEAIPLSSIEMAFKLKISDKMGRINDQRIKTKEQKSGLVFKTYQSINEIDAKLWDSLFNSLGPYNHAFLQHHEKVFQNNPLKEHNCKFNYFICFDKSSQPVLATFFSECLLKEDMFLPEDKSEIIEAERVNHPYKFSSNMLLLGSPITDGCHLYVNRGHESEFQALALLAKHLRQVSHERSLSQIILRDFIDEDFKYYRDFFLKEGFVQNQLPDINMIHHLSANGLEHFIQQMRAKYRYSLKKEVFEYYDLFETEVGSNLTDEELNECYELYLNVQKRALALNTYTLPKSLFKERYSSRDIIRLRLKENHKIVAFMYSTVHEDNYYASIVGLNYDYLLSHRIYKQILWRTVERAHELNCNKLDLGFTAALEKKKVGAKQYPAYAFVQVKDHFNLDVLNTFLSKSK